MKMKHHSDWRMVSMIGIDGVAVFNGGGAAVSVSPPAAQPGSVVLYLSGCCHPHIASLPLMP